MLVYDVRDGNGKLDLREWAELVRDVEFGRIRYTKPSLATLDAPETCDLRAGLARLAAASAGHSGAASSPLLGSQTASLQQPRALRHPLVSPLLPQRTARDSSGEAAGHASRAPPLGLLPDVFVDGVGAAAEWLPRTGLEEWLCRLPGLLPQHPPPLLGVRPLERGEAIARVLRMECSLWEAQEAYLDSHRLYLRQWIALKLQALVRAKQARRQVQRQRAILWTEQRLRSALGYWRHRTATRCFFAWKSLVLKVCVPQAAPSPTRAAGGLRPCAPPCARSCAAPAPAPPAPVAAPLPRCCNGGVSSPRNFPRRAASLIRSVATL